MKCRDCHLSYLSHFTGSLAERLGGISGWPFLFAYLYQTNLHEENYSYYTLLMIVLPLPLISRAATGSDFIRKQPLNLESNQITNQEIPPKTLNDLREFTKT